MAPYNLLPLSHNQGDVMKFWAIIKMIAEIIANLPFDANEEQVKAVLFEALDSIKEESEVKALGIAKSEWPDLVEAATPLVKYIRNKMS